MYHTKTSIVASFSRYVDLSTCLSYYSDSLIHSKNCTSIFSAISSIYRTYVLVKKATCTTWETVDSPESSQHVLYSRQDQLFTTSKEVLSFRVVVCTKNDALSADSLDEIVDFSNYFYASCLLFCFENS